MFGNNSLGAALCWYQKKVIAIKLIQLTKLFAKKEHS
jgi:hypothetical protein